VGFDGVTSVIPNTVRFSLYVDDLVVYVTAPHLAGLERRLQGTIDRIAVWTSG
jgi:hypothetical protein